MRRTTRTKTIIVVLLCVAILGMSMGFAIMSSTLNIFGTAELDPATWDIHFANLSSPTINGGSVLTAPTIQNGTTIGNYDIQLTKPGDSVSYTFDVVNNGSMGAELVTYTKEAPVCTGTGANAVTDAGIVCDNLTYTLTYTDGTAIKQGDTLAANGGTKSLKMTLAYNVSATQLPSAKVEISNLGITFVYAQTGSGADMEEGTLPEATPSANPTLLSTIRTSLATNANDTMFTDDYGNIRYRGTTPSNYVYFNCSNMNSQSSSTCETWRIIGIVDGYVKLIRQDSIGDYSWDSSDASVNGGYGVNEWSQADLMTELNDLYLNQKSGICYNGYRNANTTCDFTSSSSVVKGIYATSKSMIQEATWYLGGYDSAPEFTSSVMYGYERGTDVVSNPSDGITRTTSWTGLVGLMYPSDYGYSASASCSRNTSIFSYNEDNKACANTSWLYTTNGGNEEWFITPNSDDVSGAFDLDSRGYVGSSYDVDDNNRVRPVLHLKSSVKVKSGAGTSSSPYQLEA